MSQLRASIVMPLFNRADLTVPCLVSLSETTPAGLYEVILVDNASTDETADVLAELSGSVTVISNEVNLGFAVACNQGAQAARGDILMFLNNDTVALPGWLEPLIEVLDELDDVAAVGSKLLYPDGTIQHAGVFVSDNAQGSDFSARHLWHKAPADQPEANEPGYLQVVTGAAMAVRRSAFEQVGGFDEQYWNGFEDVDLCFALGAAGWKVVYDPRSVLYHYESASGPERFRKAQRNVELLRAKWQHRIIPDLLQLDDDSFVTHPDRTR